MRGTRLRNLLPVLILSLLVAALFAACGSGDDSTFLPGARDAGRDGTIGTNLDGSQNFADVVVFGGEGSTGTLAITPAAKVVDVNVGQALPTVQYQATLSGAPVNASFTIDRGEIGAIAVATGVFTPAGTIGGTANITATLGSLTATTTVTVFLHVTQNGAPPVPDGGVDAGSNVGGNGGVGGEGEGGQVSGGTQGSLNGSPTADPGLSWLYPYDKTVWPRGILAPLLQWQPGAKSYDAVYIHLSEAAFDYKGYFAQTATPFTHHPIPEDVWTAAAYSNGGEPLVVTLVFDSGGVAYGPIQESWNIAQGTLEGTVYYNSYGTNLAHNYCCTIGGLDFGGATLAIHGGSSSPALVAGNDSECRVCHSVSANGTTLITQDGVPSNYNSSAMYALTNANAESQLNPTDGTYAWPALSPDGTFIMTDNGPVYGANTSATSSLVSVAPATVGTPIPSTGLPAGLQAACPSFSPDGKHVAFNFYAGTGADGGAGGDRISLAALDFTAPGAFANMQTLFTPAAPNTGTSVWPSFLPTSDGVVFELETVYNGRDFGGTRSTCDATQAGCSDADANSGTEAELWWVDLKTHTPARLDMLNGKGYLPAGPNGHTIDATLNYEPTVNPVVSGGYAWVVFTSRRMYGNIATVNAYWSDPRFHDISQSPTPKKLWVAAIDLNAPPGTDPSHPAFYLPGQELLAGNSRGYWVVDPCHPDGTGCATGDECCGGYCQPGDGGALVCTNQKPSCAQVLENCTTATDCCGYASGIQCIGGRCAEPTPK